VHVRYAVELWTVGRFLNDLRGTREWDVVVRQDALTKAYEVARLVGDQITYLGASPRSTTRRRRRSARSGCR
jgi:hypothetical protein